MAKKEHELRSLEQQNKDALDEIERQRSSLQDLEGRMTQARTELESEWKQLAAEKEKSQADKRDNEQTQQELIVIRKRLEEKLAAIKKQEDAQREARESGCRVLWRWLGKRKNRSDRRSWLNASRNVNLNYRTWPRSSSTCLKVPISTTPHTVRVRVRISQNSTAEDAATDKNWRKMMHLSLLSKKLRRKLQESTVKYMPTGPPTANLEQSKLLRESKIRGVISGFEQSYFAGAAGKERRFE